jgi:hypothetical protein
MGRRRQCGEIVKSISNIYIFRLTYLAYRVLMMNQMEIATQGAQPPVPSVSGNLLLASSSPRNLRRTHDSVLSPSEIVEQHSEPARERGFASRLLVIVSLRGSLRGHLGITIS